MTTETLETTQVLVPESSVTEGDQAPKVPTFSEALNAVQKTHQRAAPVDAIPIVIFKEYAEVEINGVKKQISHEQLKAIFDKTMNAPVEGPSDIKGMLLPSNVFFISQTGQKLRINTYYPGGNRTMIYGSEKIEIAAPNIVISFTLHKDGQDWIIEGDRTRYLCTDLPISKLPKDFIDSANHSQGLYILPMSNTYEAGNMCYGSNSMPARFKDNHLRGLDWYFRFLWETPFNNDLGIKAVRDRVGVGEWYSLLAKQAKENKVFPYPDLNGWKKIDGAVESASVLRRDW